MIICGGYDAALDWTIYFFAIAASVTLIHRRNDFKAALKFIAKMRELCVNHQIELLIGQVTAYEVKDNRIIEVAFTTSDGESKNIPLDDLLVFFGLSPKLGHIAEWSLNLDRKQICVDTSKFETSTPGIYAVGDINVYPGKKKLILSGFHEAALAAFAAAKFLHPEKQV